MKIQWYKLLLVLTVISMTSGSAATIYWRGPDNTGGDGIWDNSSLNWSTSASGANPRIGPGAGDNAYFDLNATFTSPTARISIPGAITPAIGNINVANGKNVDLALGDGASLTAALLVSGGGAGTASRLTISGPALGSATMTAGRVYMSTNTGERNYVVASGANLTLNLNGDFSNINGNNSFLITQGAKVVGLQYNVNAGANRFQIQNGSVSGTSVDNSGLVQLHGDGQLSASSATMTFYTRSGGRFEAEGTGLASSVSVQINSGATLAIGTTSFDVNDEPVLRTQAATLTLNAQTRLDVGSTLEFGIFGYSSGDPLAGIDHLDFEKNSSLRLVGSGLVKLKPVLYNYTLKPGDSWQLFTGAVSITSTGAFDLASLQNEGWDTSQFNAAGNWTLTYVAIPEPRTTALLMFLGVGMLGAGWHRKWVQH